MARGFNLGIDLELPSFFALGSRNEATVSSQCSCALCWILSTAASACAFCRLSSLFNFQMLDRAAWEPNMLLDCSRFCCLRDLVLSIGTWLFRVFSLFPTIQFDLVTRSFRCLQKGGVRYMNKKKKEMECLRLKKRDRHKDDCPSRWSKYVHCWHERSFATMDLGREPLTSCQIILNFC